MARRRCGKALKKMFSELDRVRVVGEAETLPTALELLEALKPEVVILDIVLKEGSGFELLRRTKDQQHPPALIILTNYASPPFRKKAQQEGASYFFDKSTEFEKVVEILKQKT